MPTFTARSRILVLYRDGNFRVWRDAYRRLFIQELTKSGVYGPELSDSTLHGHTYWRDHVILYNYSNEHGGSRSNMLKVNRKYAQRGKVWIDRFKELLVQEAIWEVQCANWDGLGAPCPLQIELDGVVGCPVSFSISGYSMSLNNARLAGLPGRCPGPLNLVTYNRRNVSFPGDSDCYGITMAKLADVRYRILRRKCND